MNIAIALYQLSIVGSVWYLTTNYGYLGYLLPMMFWTAFTFGRVQTAPLTALQTTVLLLTGYFMWPAAYADFKHELTTLSNPWLLIGTAVGAVVLLGTAFRWLNGLVYTNINKRIEDAREFAKNPQFKAVAKKGALMACGVADILDTADPVYLRVPFSDKDQAKLMGARWDPSRSAWYVPPGTPTQPFEKWMRQ